MAEEEEAGDVVFRFFEGEAEEAEGVVFLGRPRCGVPVEVAGEGRGEEAEVVAGGAGVRKGIELTRRETFMRRAEMVGRVSEMTAREAESV